MKQVAGIFIILIYLCACNNKANNAKDVSVHLDSLKKDSVKLKETNDSVNVESARPTPLLIHHHHDDDDQYPWYDTSLEGSWTKKSFKDSLLSIFDSDTTRSLYQYTKGFDQCDNQLISIYIEGCKKDNIFYIKNQGCEDKYIASSDFAIDEKDTFQLQDVYSGEKYLFESPAYSQLFIDGEKYVDNFRMQNLTELLNGVYVIYDQTQTIIDTVNYTQGYYFSKSDTLADMQLLNIFHLASHYDEKPSYRNSDLVSVGFYTGDSTEAEVPGGTETVPKTKDILFDLIRNKEGFTLYNAYDPLEKKLLQKGLVYRFDLIAVFKYRKKY